jgi:hypothetical protein
MVEQGSTYVKGTCTRLLTALAYTVLITYYLLTAILTLIFQTFSALQIYVTLFLNNGINIIWIPNDVEIVNW